MKTQSFNELLKNNAYPGRGILIGLTHDGKKAVCVYFIMGRSENSRNRIFSITDDGIKTQAFEPEKLSDPSLVIYNPVRTFDKNIIVTNGDQTDTICDFLHNGGTFEEALRTRRFEPDPPIFTPRISGIMSFEKRFEYKLSILKSEGEGETCLRFFYEYNIPIKAKGHFIHTYKCDGDPVPSFEGEPVCIEIPEIDSLEKYAEGIFHSINNDNKVSLYASLIDIESFESENIIINKNGGGIEKWQRN